MATGDEGVLELKTATKRVVHDLGGIVAAASCTRVGLSQLSDYGNINRLDKMAPVDVVLDMERISGEPHITSALARLQGYHLVPVGARPVHELVPALQRIAQDNGQLFALAVHALTGGEITLPERQGMAAQLSDMMQWAQEALAALVEQAP